MISLGAHAGMQMNEGSKAALKVFREDPMAERSTNLCQLIAFHAYPKHFKLEKVKGAKNFRLMKSKVWPGLSQLMPLLCRQT
jgi:hypothetical protein